MTQMQDKLDADIKAALVGGDRQSATTLRMLKSALHNARIDKGDELSEAEAFRVLQKEAKQRRESAESFRSAGRIQQAEAEEAELIIIEGYLPQPISDSDLEKIVDAAILETKASSVTDMGQVMRLVQPQVASRADGSKVAELVRTKLQA